MILKIPKEEFLGKFSRNFAFLNFMENFRIILARRR